MSATQKASANMFGGLPLNRLSWLRTSHHFLNAAVALPESQWVLFNAGQPLVALDPHSSTPSRPQLAYLTTADLTNLLGPQPFFGQGKETGTIVTDEINNVPYSTTEAARHYPQSLPIVFLGIHEKHEDANVSAVLPVSEFSSVDAAAEAIKRLYGTPYFATDVADLVSNGQFTEEELLNLFTETSQGKEGKLFSWSEARALVAELDRFTAGIFAGARSLTDWNYRHKFCPGCGSRTYSMWGGWKISCLTLLPWVEKTGKKPCPSGQGLNNYTHPRTDAVVIIVTIDETGNRVLLGRGKRFPGKLYSALAGFIEPGEQFEDAVAREMGEEVGVRVWDIRYYSCQPWPYPSSLLVGFYARADSTQTIRTDLDNELADARWFTREEVLSVLRDAAGTHLSRDDYKKLSDNAEGKKEDDSNANALAAETKIEVTQVEESLFKLPPITAVAGVLIRAWAEGRVEFEKIIKQ